MPNQEKKTHLTQNIDLKNESKKSVVYAIGKLREKFKEQIINKDTRTIYAKYYPSETMPNLSALKINIYPLPERLLLVLAIGISNFLGLNKENKTQGLFKSKTAQSRNLNNVQLKELKTLVNSMYVLSMMLIRYSERVRKNSPEVQEKSANILIKKFILPVLQKICNQNSKDLTPLQKAILEVFSSEYYPVCQVQANTNQNNIELGFSNAPLENPAKTEDTNMEIYKLCNELYYSKGSYVNAGKYDNPDNITPVAMHKLYNYVNHLSIELHAEPNPQIQSKL